MAQCPLCPGPPPPIPGEPARRRSTEENASFGLLLGFNLTGLHRSWAGFNPGLITAQFLWARSPPEEPLALPSPKHSLEGFGHLGREDQGAHPSWAEVLTAGCNPGFGS